MSPAELAMLRRVATGDAPYRIGQSKTCRLLELRGLIVTHPFPTPPEVTPAGRAALEET